MKRRQLGFTVVEAMVGVTILTVLTLAMAGTFLVGYRAINNEARVIAADSAVSNASLWLTRDLQSETATVAGTIQTGTRSEERRVGKECRSRWSPRIRQGRSRR